MTENTEPVEETTRFLDNVDKTGKVYRQVIE